MPSQCDDVMISLSVNFVGTNETSIRNGRNYFHEL